MSVGELNGVLFRMALAFTMDIGAPVSVGELNGVLFRASSRRSVGIWLTCVSG